MGGDMANDINSETEPRLPAAYQIRIEGHLGDQWTDWFDGLAITLDDNGDTLLGHGPSLSRRVERRCQAATISRMSDGSDEMSSLWSKALTPASRAPAAMVESR